MTGKKIIFELEKNNLQKRIEKLKSEIKYKEEYLKFTQNFLDKLTELEDRIEVVEVNK